MNTTENQHKKYIKLYDLVANLYNHILLHTEGGEKALAYLESRGFTKDTIKKLNIGYSYKGNMLSILLTRHGFELDLGKQFGLLKEFDKEPKYRDFFYGRIMFPIRNDKGEIIAFSGRTLPGNTHPAKYLNTPETPYFRKGEIIYNFDQAQHVIKEKNAAILLEGYFDTGTAIQHGLENVVSLMGTTLSEFHIVKLKQFTDRVVLCLDGDKAGYENAKRNSELLIAYGFDVRIALMPKGIDPHEYITAHGIDMFKKEIIKTALPYHHFLKEFLKFNKDLSDEVDTLQYVNDVLKNLNVVTSQEQGEIFRDLAKEVDIQTNMFMKAIRYEMNR